MRFKLSRHQFAAAALAAMLATTLSCSDSATAPDTSTTRAPTDLRLLSAPYGTPALAKTQVTFTAVKGAAQTVEIWYHAAPGRTDSLRFLQFSLGPNSLDKRPDGSTIAMGESVDITITVNDPSHFELDFEPSGLSFAASDRPTLRLSFAACGADLNYDGKVDAADQAILDALSFWRQEAPFQPWLKLASAVRQDVRDVTAELGGFTGYALMY